MAVVGPWAPTAQIRRPVRRDSRSAPPTNAEASAGLCHEQRMRALVGQPARRAYNLLHPPAAAPSTRLRRFLEGCRQRHMAIQRWHPHGEVWAKCVGVLYQGFAHYSGTGAAACATVGVPGLGSRGCRLGELALPPRRSAPDVGTPEARSAIISYCWRRLIRHKGTCCAMTALQGHRGSSTSPHRPLAGSSETRSRSTSGGLSTGGEKIDRYIKSPWLALTANAERERVLRLSSHAGLRQVLPGPPLAHSRVHTNKSCS